MTQYEVASVSMPVEWEHVVLALEQPKPWDGELLTGFQLDVRERLWAEIECRIDRAVLDAVLGT